MPRYKNKPVKISQLKMHSWDTEPLECQVTNINLISWSSQDLPLTSSQFTPTNLSSNFVPSPPPTPSIENDKLEIGTINLRLHIPGLLDLLIPIPAPPAVNETKYLNKIFDQFKHKYWTKLSVDLRPFKCLICDLRFQKQISIQSHLATHMRFPLARCTKCSKPFFHMLLAEKHVKNCSVGFY